MSLDWYRVHSLILEVFCLNIVAVKYQLVVW